MRRTRWKAGLLALAWLSGCYTYVPVESSTPPVGETVSFEITDRGRVSLAERMGTGIRSIEGRVMGAEGDQYVVSVFRVASIDGQSSAWSGETIRLDRDFVSRAHERRLSKSRSWLAAAVMTGVIVAVVTTTGLAGFFDDDDIELPPEPNPDDLRPKRW